MAHECHYNVARYSRDDSGFWLDCVECGRGRIFQVNTLDELYELFGLNDDEEDYKEDEEDHWAAND